MVVILMKEARLVIAMNDLDFGIRDVAFEAKVLNRYGTFDQIANKNMKDLSYAYLHCDLLNKKPLTIITLRVKSPHIEMHEHHLQKGMFGIKSKSKRGFKKGDMHVVITIELTTIVSSILAFQLELIPMFFHMDSIKEFKSFIQSWRSPPIVVIIVGVKGIGDYKGEKQLLIVNGKGEFEQVIFSLGNNFKTKYEQLLEAYNGGQCAMGLIKNVTRSKGD
jgi:hypothetical protein